MTHKISLFLAAGAALLLAPLSSSHAQRYGGGGSRLGAFAGGGGARSGAVNSAAGARGYNGASFRNNRNFYRGGYGGYYGGRSRYFYRGSYYYYDPFFFGGFGYPYYYGGYGPGFGVGYYGYGGYGYGDGPYGDRVYSGRIASEVNGGRRGGGDDDEDGDERGGRGGRYSPNSMARAVQSELKERGYYRGSVDGQFGAGTASALRSFQREKGLKVTGRLDERTLKALGFDQR